MERNYEVSSLVLLGADLQGLELRMLGHYLHPFDGGEYANEVINGDPHAKTLAAIKALNEELNRDNAKTFIYAYLYGSGDANLGFIVMPTASESKRKKLGKEARANVEHMIPALGLINKRIKDTTSERNWLKGIDGRQVFIRSDHAALNTLLQSGGAIVAKKWVVQSRKLWQGNDIFYIRRTWYHDETQTSVLKDQAQQAGELQKQAALEAGQLLGMKVPIEAAFGIGESWAATH